MVDSSNMQRRKTVMISVGTISRGTKRMSWIANRLLGRE